MKLLKTIPQTIVIVINIIMVVAMLVCAYSVVLPPQHYARLSACGMLFPVFLVVNVPFIVFWLVFKRKFVLISLVGMLLCAGRIRTYIPVNLPQEPPAGAIKVLSYNIMNFGGEASALWEENEIVQYLQHSNADIVCLQEATNAGTKKALEVLGEQYPYSRLHEAEQNYLVCLSKYPILSERKIDYVSSSNASYAYEVAVGTKTVLVVNNHLESYRLTQEDKDDYKSIIANYQHPKQNKSKSKSFQLLEKLAYRDSLRGMQVDSVVAFVQQNKGRYIVACGDFNASPISYTHYTLTEFLNDAYTRSGNGPGISYYRSGMYFRLDHILISPNLKAYGAVVDRSIKASDHYPISCFIRFDEE